MSLGHGHGDLNVLISEVKDMRSTAKAFMNAQSAGEKNMCLILFCEVCLLLVVCCCVALFMLCILCVYTC
jgi:hypothetical protein